jgi:aspartyl-tRNA(Asn)/glutamyl-tRNA(Gln) amidotransferase subunit C
MADISKEEVEEIALLARLQLTEAEVERLRGELTAILGYAERLQSLNTDGVEPMTHAVPLDCPMRADEVGASFTQDEALAQAPQPLEGHFGVPRIIEVS